MENPIKQLRKEANMTMEAFCSGAGVSKQTLIRTEQGCYEQIPPAIHQYMLQHWPYSEVHDIPIKYRKWQKWQRTRNYGLLSIFPRWDKWVGKVHPFVYWRETSGIHARIIISKLYCVHPATMSRFENPNALSSSVPEQLIDALLESGYPVGLVQDLCDKYSKWALTVQTSSFSEVING